MHEAVLPKFKEIGVKHRKCFEETICPQNTATIFDVQKRETTKTETAKMRGLESANEKKFGFKC